MGMSDKSISSGNLEGTAHEKPERTDSGMKKNDRILFGKRDIYFLNEKIGRGGTANVWKARLLPWRRNLAVKIREIVPEEETADWYNSIGVPAFSKIHFLSPLRAEAELLKELNDDLSKRQKAGLSAGIPEYREYFRDKYREYLVMEYLRGETVGQLLRRGKKFSFSEILTAGIALCEIFCFFQQKEKPVFYLDVSPDNVMIGLDGKIWLTDFGAAAVWRRRREMETAVLCATKEYAAPELYRGNVSENTDLYALGMLLCRMWKREGISFLLERTDDQKNKRMPGAGEYGKDCAERMLEQALICCTQNKPEDRFRNARELYDKLKEIEKQKTV